jgi:hypothetical protein
MSETHHREVVASYLTGFLGILLLWNIYLNIQADKSTNLNYWYAVGYSLFYVFVAVFGFIKLKQVGAKSATAKALTFMSIGALIFAFAFWLYTYNIYKYQVDIPYPSVADYFFLSFVPFVAIGFSFLIRIFAPVLSRRVVIESFLLMLVGVGVMFYFFILPQFGQDVTPLEKVFNIIYPLDDTILLSLILIAVRASGGRIQGYFLRFIIAFALMITGDLLYSYRTSQNIQWNGDIVDLIFTFTAYAFSMAVLKMSGSVVEPTATFNPTVAVTLEPQAPESQPVENPVG